MPNLVVDIGNTRIKAGVFENSNLLKAVVFDKAALRAHLTLLLNEFPSNRALISDVSGEWETLMPEGLEGITIHKLDHTLSLPFKNLYGSKQTLGSDRIALVAGALHFFPGENCLVMDAGTCVTYDLLNSSQEYLGGNISPGLHMRLKAMNQFTGKLPLPEFQRPANVLGKDTESCLLTGAYYGLIGEMNGFMAAYERDFPNLKVLLTGGDANHLAKSLKSGIFVHEHLLLYGLNQLLNHHAS